MGERVGQVLLAFGGDVHGQPVARANGVAERFLDDDARRVFESRVLRSIVARVQAHQDLRGRPAAVAERPGHHAQDVIVMRIQLLRRRGQCNQAA